MNSSLRGRTGRQGAVVPQPRSNANYIGQTPDSSATAPAAETAPIDNRVFVLVLQHPRERREPLATAAITVAALRHSALVVGLSWPNLARALGRAVDPKRWAVLYLGSVRPAALASTQEVIALDRSGAAIAAQPAARGEIDGIVVLDGTWQEAKTLWWRNPWLLKLRRLVLNPTAPSRYGRIRREPRQEALATLEAVALVLRQLDGGDAPAAALLRRLDPLVAAGSAHRKGSARRRRY
jgi:tRNA-uridine aminocarboxypropyltransferase